MAESSRKLVMFCLPCLWGLACVERQFCLFWCFCVISRLSSCVFCRLWRLEDMKGLKSYGNWQTSYLSYSAESGKKQHSARIYCTSLQRLPSFSSSSVFYGLQSSVVKPWEGRRNSGCTMLTFDKLKFYNLFQTHL